MVYTKTLRPLLFVAIAAVSVLLASTSVQAAPTTPAAMRCVVCDEWPICDYRLCQSGYYCEVNQCTCQTECHYGDIP
ncbi:hypothetical protein K457DRAFT_19159 [Linnemannia elongata AG-77]|uniref:Membrane anchor Opy2 N-terminal domain-containing protein n=1 Tax=Linnemannia elongata AG-77 TaxID=1314771 RepID=A0A197JY24_9FUNG|nr:hypothetical protein K457DRAFT_19159 [Linnemannia elongata AG-77]